MNQQKHLFLCSTIHDPEFRLKSLLESTLSTIKNLFKTRIVCCTAATSDELQRYLTNEDFNVKISNSEKQIDVYRLALKATLSEIDNTPNQMIFYIDFDRLLHWIYSYSHELTEILNNNPNIDYLHIGRTQRAFNTHPLTQKDTENIINEVSSKILGFPDTKDIISVCAIFTKYLGERLLKVNNITSTGFYGTWPIILWTLANTKRYIEVEALEWETPDRFKKEINKLGYEKWLEQFQSSSEWKKRVQFVREFMLEIHELTKYNINM